MNIPGKNLIVCKTCGATFATVDSKTNSQEKNFTHLSENTSMSANIAQKFLLRKIL
eukprot:TRINITY_DN15839_c0_g1_i1.p1 TRINITY_DN15839_c0_g1~~TRINITY_DN15839_c0_g1_i1.p1  ORF type:complete len:56 (+),score=9.63 TRINITY_DN15839_c0_g1_i1:220-387(+)